MSSSGVTDFSNPRLQFGRVGSRYCLTVSDSDTSGVWLKPSEYSLKYPEHKKRFLDYHQRFWSLIIYLTSTFLNYWFTILIGRIICPKCCLNSFPIFWGLFGYVSFTTRSVRSVTTFFL